MKIKITMIMTIIKTMLMTTMMMGKIQRTKILRHFSEFCNELKMSKSCGRIVTVQKSKSIVNKLFKCVCVFPFQKTDSGLEDCNGTIKSFSCKQCGRTYDKKKFLDAHVKVHDVNTPFSCDCCDKKFRFLSSLKAHSFVHVGESRDISNTAASVLEYKAISTCTRGPELNRNDKDAKKINIFAFLNTKENPLDDFLNDLPFTCKSCNFKTRAPAELLNHLKTHSKSERYTCKHCNKSYKLHSNLKMHEKIHTINKLKEILIENTKSKKSEQTLFNSVIYIFLTEVCKCNITMSLVILCNLLKNKSV